MSRRMVASALAASLLSFLGGCAKYEPKPLVPEDVVAEAEETRGRPDGPESEASSPDRPHHPDGSAAPVPFTFPRAVELMARHGPALKEARAEYQTALARARIKTPLPNPALELGPNYGFGPDVGKLYRLQPFGSLGFIFPTGGKRKRQDELNRVNAEALYIGMQARHRELYLGLRRLYAQWTLNRAKLEARKKIEESAGKSVAVGRKLIEAGLATALDLGLLDLEAARIRTERLGTQREQADTEGELSATLGVHADYFSVPPEPALPELSGAARELKELRDILVANHPELARLRASYEVAEAELRLEIARQYPDFRFGPSFEGDPGEKKTLLGLALGIELPIFDRNQQGIASSKAKREEIRAKYEAAANRALAALERAWRNIQLAGERLKLIETELAPKAEANIALARKSIEAGATDTLRFLETERSQRTVTIEAIEAEFAVRESWVELEQAVGLPLIPFPGEASEALPRLDACPDEPTSKEAAP